MKDTSQKRPKISVCIVAYNHERYIADCLSSVLGQRVDAELEILVGDDCSTDGTRQIISEYAQRYPQLIRPTFHPKNFGGCHNYQSLIEQSSGDYVAHLDGDDYWLPGKLQSQITMLSGRPECVAIFSNAIVMRENGEIFGMFNNAIPTSFDLDFLLAEGNFLNHSSMLYRQRLKSEILSIHGPYVDYKVNLRFAQQGLLCHTNQVHVVYRIGSATSAISNQPEYVRKLYLEALLELPAQVQISAAMRSVMTKFFWSDVYQALRHGRIFGAYDELKKIGAIAPEGTVSRIIVKCMLRPFAGVWQRMSGYICRRHAPLKVYHDR